MSADDPIVKGRIEHRLVAKPVADYTNEAQQRLLRLLTLLAGHEVLGLAPGEIAKTQGCAAPMVTRDLANLREGGYAEQLPDTGRWRLAPQVVQIAVRHMTAMDQATRRLGEINQRFSRSG
jgi:DNA-binding IclR family transcriptional regulator